MYWWVIIHDDLFRSRTMMSHHGKLATPTNESWWVIVLSWYDESLHLMTYIWWQTSHTHEWVIDLVFRQHNEMMSHHHTTPTNESWWVTVIVLSWYDESLNLMTYIWWQTSYAHEWVIDLVFRQDNEMMSHHHNLATPSLVWINSRNKSFVIESFFIDNSFWWWIFTAA